MHRTFYLSIVIAALTSLLAVNSARSEPAQHAINQDGRYINPRSDWRYVARSTHIPINKKYHELTPEEKLLISTFYESMLPGDEPPFPRDGMKPVLQALAEAQKRLLVSGTLYLLVDVDRTGKAQNITAHGSPSPAMTRVASYILLSTPFKPALCAGAHCAMQFPFMLEFKVE